MVEKRRKEKQSQWEQLAHQQKILFEVATSSFVAEGDVESISRLMTKQVSEYMDVERVSVWLFDETETILRCIDLYELSSDKHSGGLVLNGDEFNNEFEALKNSKYVDANDALTDSRTAGYVENYLKPLKIISMLDGVIRSAGRNLGVLCLEHVDKHHDWTTEEITFVCQLADQIALTLSNYERKRAEESKSEIMSRLRRAEIASKSGNWELHLDRQLIIASEGAKKIYGYHGTKFAWDSIKNARLPEYSEYLDAAFRNLIINGEMFDVEYKIRNGETGEIIDIHSVAEYDKDKKILFGVLQDITERKRAEEILNQSENRFRDLFDDAPVCYHELDREGRVSRVNKTELEFLGYSAEEMIGHYVWDFVDEPELSKKRVLVKLTGAWPKDQSTERFYNKKDGTKVPVLIMDRMLRDKDGIITGIRTTMQDISARVSAEDETKRTNKELEKLNSEKDKLFSIIAHDLRSPFHGLLGITEILRTTVNELSLGEIAAYINAVHNSVANLYKLLENLLVWGQLQKGSISFTPKELSLISIFSQCEDSIKQRAMQKGIDIRNEIPGDQKIYADEKMITSVLRNLLSNAVKFTRKDGKIIVGARNSDYDMVEISVTDTGIGMSNDIVGKLFKLGERVSNKGTDNEPSAGLGLILCKEFVEKHGGKIWVESEGEDISLDKSGGSTFYFTIPAADKL